VVHDEGYDLVVLGAENRSVVERVYFGPVVEACLERLMCSVAVVVPSRDLGRRNP
jgi:nucleotide-binding universal stress UspA family protein